MNESSHGKGRSMAIEVVTKEDLEQFRRQLLNDFRQLLLSDKGGKQLAKPWLKNSEVQKLLSISSNTIQRLRVSGSLPSKKVGGTHYYRFTDIEKLMNSNAT